MQKAEWLRFFSSLSGPARQDRQMPLVIVVRVPQPFGGCSLVLKNLDD